MKPSDYIKLGIAIVVAVVLYFGIRHYRSLQEKAAVGEQRGGVLTNASAAIEDGVVAEAEAAKINTGLAQGRENFHVTIEEAKRNEPETADRADRVVPDSVRSAYRERRRARERLGCVGSECEKGRDADAATER